MSMTLKCAAHDHRPGDARTVSWIGGVTEVHRISQARSGDRLKAWEIYYRSHGVRDFGSPDPSPDGDDPGEGEGVWLTLLSVLTEATADHSYIVVQTAWLLGPNGDTIERIAP